LPTLLTPRLEWLAGDIQSVKAVLEKIVAVNDQLRGACVQVSADAQLAICVVSPAFHRSPSQCRTRMLPTGCERNHSATQARDGSRLIGALVRAIAQQAQSSISPPAQGSKLNAGEVRSCSGQKLGQ
jgi:hypothetical protein